MADLAAVELALPSGLAAVPASKEASVVGEQAMYEIPAGSLLDPGALTSGAVVTGAAVVGASLASNQLPDELGPGDEVLVVFTSSATGALAGNSGTPPPTHPPGGANPTGHAAAQAGQLAPGAILATAQVLDVVLPGSTATAAATSGNLVTVSLAVPESSAALVTAASAANEISLALVPGESLGGRA